MYVIKVKKLSLGLVFVLALISSLKAEVQTINIINSSLVINRSTFDQDTTDTRAFAIDSVELSKVVDLRTVFERQNKTYTTPKSPDKALLRFLKKDELEISNEAMYWAKMIRDASYYFDNNVTFRDTMIVDPMYLPIVFRADPFTDEELTFYSMDFMKSKFVKPELYQTDTIFDDYLKRKKSSDMAIAYVEEKHPSYIRYTERQMPQELVKTKYIKKDTYENIQLKVESEADFSDVTPVKFIPERRYWTSGFESAIQLSQNYISDNWHKGGNSNFSIFTKNALIYNYTKDMIKVVNEIEQATSIYTASEDTHHSYKVSNDILRLHNNVGYKAFSKWSYTFDTEFKTQLFKNFKENSEEMQAAFMAPFSVTFGVGMMYDLGKTFASNKHKKLALSVNLAPLSYTYMYTRLKDPDKADMGRHGFKVNEKTGMYDNSFSNLGSNIKASMTFNFSRNVTWQSRLDYLTSYENVKMEFENTLTLAISRFFTTRIYLYLRYDDAAKERDKDWNYFQLNQLLSFGFNYRW